MLFSRPDTISTINRYCIAVQIDKNAVGARSRVEEQMFPALSAVAAYVLSPDGAILSRRRLESVDGLLTDIVAGARTTGVVADSMQLPWSGTTAAEKAPAGGLMLSLTARLLPRGAGEDFQLPVNPEFRIPLNRKSLPDPVQMFDIRYKTPTFDTVALTRDDVLALIGPALEGRPSWTVDDTAACHLLWLFRPPTHYPHPRISDVRTAHLQGRVAALEGDKVRIRLDGTFSIEHRWFPTASEGVWLGTVNRHGHWAEGAVNAECVVDAKTRQVESFVMASADALYKGTDGTCLPFGVEASLKP